MNKEAIAAQIIGMIGAVALGLGIYGINVPKPESLHPLLGDQTFVISLIVSGVILMAIELMVMWPIWKQKAQQRRTQPVQQREK